MKLMAMEDSGQLAVQEKISKFVQQLQSDAPQGSGNGLPEYYIDPSVIAQEVPYCTDLDDITDATLDYSKKRIDYIDGTPVVDGIPFWERLDGEPIVYYNYYKQYRDMCYGISSEGAPVSANHKVRCTRSIARLADMLNITGKQLTVLSKTYHWAMRNGAFDAYKQRLLALNIQHEQSMLEAKHAKYSNTILDQAVRYLESNPDKIDPKVALQMVELGMKYGRISTGLMGDKPGAQDRASKHQTNIQIAQNTTHMTDVNGSSNLLNDNNLSGVGGNLDQNSAGGAGGAGKGGVEQAFEAKIKNKDGGTLVQILHVLNKSEAFQQETNKTTTNKTNKTTTTTNKTADKTNKEQAVDLTPTEEP